MDGATPDPDYRRILTAFQYQEPDRLPMMELTVDYPVQEAFLGRPIRSLADEIEFWRQAGYDYIYLKPPYEFPGIPAVMSFGSDIKRDATAPASAAPTAPKCQRPPLVSRDALCSYPWPDAATVSCDNFVYAAANLPEGMGIIAGVGGIFARAWMLMGFEHFCMASITDPCLVEEVFQCIASVQLDVARRLVRMPRVFALWYSDDFAYAEATMVALDTIRKMLFPHMKRLADIVHEAGMPFIYHGCGRLTEVLDDLVALGVDALHPIEPKAMDIYEVKQKLHGRVAVIGNVPVGEVLCLGTPDQVTVDVRERIRRLAPGGGYAVGSSNSITHYVPVENYRELTRSVRRFGRYPIRV